VSLVDLKFVAGRNTTPQEVNEALIAAADGVLNGVLTYTHHPLVSSDLNHDPHSSTILLDQTKVIDGNFVNIMGWYDNEWGFSNRMVDVTKAFAALL
jgi:glyceraldehyde 3-phosphate dehydrogenase